MGLFIRNGVVYSGGANGKSAYEQAVEGGYQGTEAQFKQLLSTADTRLTDLEDDIGDVATVLDDIISGTSIQPLSVTQNGTYNPPTGVDGYAPVNVNVSGESPIPLYAEFNSEGLSDDGWVSTDGDHLVNKGTGSWNVSDGKLVCDGQQNAYIEVPNQNLIVEFTASIDNDFVPTSSNSWYANSAITGGDLSGDAYDGALLIRKSSGNFIFGVGYKASTSPPFGTIQIPADTEHVYTLFLQPAFASAFVDGTLVARLESTSYQNGTLRRLGVLYCWGAPASAAKVKGKISRIRIWNYNVEQQLPV